MLSVYNFESATHWRTWVRSDRSTGTREKSMMARWLQTYIGLMC